MRFFKAPRTVLTAGILVAAGCQSYSTSPAPSVSRAALVIDEAMQKRDWELSTANYSSSGHIAGPTGFLWEQKWNQPEWTYAFTDLPIFLGDVVATPVALVITPPWSKVQYAGEQIPASYTVMPALPPTQMAMERTEPRTEIAPMPAPTRTVEGAQSEVVQPAPAPQAAPQPSVERPVVPVPQAMPEGAQPSTIRPIPAPSTQPMRWTTPSMNK